MKKWLLIGALVVMTGCQQADETNFYSIKDRGDVMVIENIFVEAEKTDETLDIATADYHLKLLGNEYYVWQGEGDTGKLVYQYDPKQVYTFDDISRITTILERK
ncbi:hypothetical protein [Metalysinibacillus jejuensis]|uniref:hypothetical protein n=1 Tax=Metalysinibacillus jejuensis TaxID=914327 RepID=UPI000D384018|nr:hypothetical protein [Metalysinibacillus jejuensis]